jgi:hypothetical protein
MTMFTAFVIGMARTFWWLGQKVIIILADGIDQVVDSRILAAGGFEPVPVNAGTMPPQVLKALASKESGPPPPKLDAAALAALIASTRAEVPLPDRNPRR